jgi:hypothetical protein
MVSFSSMPTTLKQLEQWIQVPREIEGLEFKAARTAFHGDKLMDYCVGIAVLHAHKKFAEMDRKERLNACFWHCVLRYITGHKMTNSSLRERFTLPQGRSETVSRIISDAIHENKIKSDDPLRASRKFASYIPYWA